MVDQKKTYGNMRIMSFDGSTIYLRSHGQTPQMYRPLTGIKDGKLRPEMFMGIIDESLDTDKLREVYEKHQDEMKFPYLAEERYCRALVSVSFDYAVKEFIRFGRRFVRYGCSVTDEDMQDHICIRNGMLIAIEVSLEKDKQYLPVVAPADDAILEKYFAYDEKTKTYCQTKKAISSVVKKSEIRASLYKDGFDIDGIHYVRYKRSAGSSRDGRCLFIAEPLYAEMMSWSACGLHADDVSDQASWQAYIALTLSSIESVIRLPKKAILIIPDKVSRFTTTAVCVTEDKEDGLAAREEETTIENVIWDGEALLDAEVFEENGYANKGMMLLRNHFFKTCAFNTNLQQWFRDNGITEIRQLAGHTRARKVEDIKLVITESSLKYLKFKPKDASYEEGFEMWLDAVYEGKNTSAFGVVKTDKPSLHMHGNMVYTNYQMLNTINISPTYMNYFLQDSLDYLAKMQSDPMYLRYNVKNLMLSAHPDGKYAPLSLGNYREYLILDMMSYTGEFQRTELYKTYRNEVCRRFKEKLKKGRVLVEGNYETIFGNPYEFLCAVIDKHYEPTESLLFEENEAYTTRFKNGEWMLCVRSPHITIGNLYLVQNQDYYEIDTYFNLTSSIICVNAINNNLQQRLNGCDYDSDSMLVTPNQLLCDAANAAYNCFGVPVCKVEPVGKTKHKNTPEDLAELDIAIAENKIGEIVNLSQFLNSLYWNEVAGGRSIEDMKPLYHDICKLAVLSGMEIDKAKRMYNVKTSLVLRKLKKARDEFKKAHNGVLPAFFLNMISDENVPKPKDDISMMAPMSTVYDTVSNIKNHTPRNSNVPLLDLFELDPSDAGNNDSLKKKNIIGTVIEAHKKISFLQMRARTASDGSSKIYAEEAEREFAACMAKVEKNIVNEHILCLLLKELDKKESSYEISGCRYLLFACMLYAKDSRLLKRVKGMRTYVYPEMFMYQGDPDDNPDTFGWIFEYVYGYKHYIVDYTIADTEDN